MYGTLVLLHMNCRSRVSSVTLGDIEDVPRIIDNSMFSHSELDAAFFISVMQSEEEQTLLFILPLPTMTLFLMFVLFVLMFSTIV